MTRWEKFLCWLSGHAGWKKTLTETVLEPETARRHAVIAIEQHCAGCGRSTFRWVA